MKRFLACFLLALLVVSCGGSAAPTTIPTGTYISNAGAGREELKLSGSDYVIVQGGASTVQGTYTSTERELTLTTSDLSSFCRGTLTPAVYSWKLEENLLTLKKQSDSCDYRAQLLDQVWQKR